MYSLLRVSSLASAEFSNSQGCIDDAGRRHGNIFDVTRRRTCCQQEKFQVIPPVALYLLHTEQRDEQWATSNIQWELSFHHVRKSRTFIGYRSLLITPPISSAIDVTGQGYLFTSMALSQKHKPNRFFSLHLSFYVLFLYLPFLQWRILIPRNLVPQSVIENDIF